MKKVLLISTILLSASVLFADISEKDFHKAYKEISLEKDAHKKFDGAVKILQNGNDYQKFLMLKPAADASFELGNYDNAIKYATELLALADHFQSDWNHGNAIHHGNLILGRIALQENDIKSAEDYLLKAGNTDEPVKSPIMDGFVKAPRSRLANPEE
jgi:tetratricopeptide (TPR) repeat protein